MSIVAPNLYVTPASPVVLSQMARLNTMADDSTQRANSAIDGLLTTSIPNADLDPRFQFTDDELQSLLNQLGPLPGYENTDWLEGLDLSSGSQNFVFNPALMARLDDIAPGFIAPPLPDAPALPDEPSDPGDAVEIPAPARPTLHQFDAPVVPDDIPVPEYTDYTSEVPFPTLREITLPDAPIIDFASIQFEGIRPTFEGTVPDIADFEFTNAVYSSTMLNDIQASILTMLQGGNGLPPEVEDAIFERAREREAELSAREIDTVTDGEAAKGWRLPSGALFRRTDRLRKDARYKISALHRDQFVEHFKVQVEQFRQALTQGIALEEALMRNFNSAEDRRFQAAQIRNNMAIAIFNAYVSKLNAEQSLYATDAQVYRDRFAAEKVKVEVYAEELRGKQLIGELNAQDVAIFAQRLNALKVNADLYLARMQGYGEFYRGVEAKTNVYKAQLESNTQLVNIYEADTRAFGELVRAGQSREERFRIKGEIYGKKVDAWAKVYDGMLKAHDSSLETEKMKLSAYEADSARLATWINGESARVQALVQKYQAMASEIGAKSDVEKARYTLMLSLAQAQIERMRAAADILLKNGEINIQSGLSAAGLQLRALETAAQTLAQMAAGFTSAANVNASISDSSGASLSYNLSGELEIN